MRGPRPKEIESLSGERLIWDDRYLGSTSLFVFLKDEKVVRALMVTPDVFHPGDSHKLFGHDVMLSSTNDSLVRFIELN